MMDEMKKPAGLEVEIEVGGGKSLELPSKMLDASDMEVGAVFERPTSFIKKDDNTVCVYEVNGKKVPPHEKYEQPEDMEEMNPENPDDRKKATEMFRQRAMDMDSKGYGL